MLKRDVILDGFDTGYVVQVVLVAAEANNVTFTFLILLEDDPFAAQLRPFLGLRCRALRS